MEEMTTGVRVLGSKALIAALLRRNPVVCLYVQHPRFSQLTYPKVVLCHIPHSPGPLTYYIIVFPSRSQAFIISSLPLSGSLSPPLPEAPSDSSLGRLQLEVVALPNLV